MRLTLAHDDLLAAQQRQLRQLEDARARILAATDREQAAAAAALRGDVETLDRVGRRVARARQSVRPERRTRSASWRTSSEPRATTSVGWWPVCPQPGSEEVGCVRPSSISLVELPCRSTCTRPVTSSASTRVETTAYFVCAEAVTNAVKHSDATRVDVVVGRGPDALRLRVEDDGVGGADAAGRGLRGLADRVDAAAGRLRVESPSGAGTRIEVTLPLDEVVDQPIRTQGSSR